MKKFNLLISILALFAIIPLSAKKIKTGPASAHLKVEKIATAATAADCDTIFAPVDFLTLSGYDKTNAALTEAFFVTNNSDSLIVKSLGITLTYSDMTDRQLHEATHTVNCDIPPRQTRQLAVPSWDRQHSFHYFRSVAPKRKASTPFKVSSAINWVKTGGI
jgi:hypothetical protein